MTRDAVKINNGGEKGEKNIAEKSTLNDYFRKRK